MAEFSSSPDTPSHTKSNSPLILLFLSLAAGLTVASVVLVAKRLMQSDAELSEVGTGYSPAIAAPQPLAATESGSSTPAERAETFDHLRAQLQHDEIDLDRHFNQLILPEYNEAELYSWRLLGFRLTMQPQGSAGASDRLAESERGK